MRRRFGAGPPGRVSEVWSTRIIALATAVIAAVAMRAWWSWGAASPDVARAGATGIEARRSSSPRRPELGPGGAGAAEAVPLAGEPALGTGGPGAEPRFRTGEALRYFAPRQGEKLLDYRDRVLPVAQAVVAPQRARARRLRDRFSEQAGLSDRQRERLDSITADAAEQISDRVLQGVLSGELSPSGIKPMTGILFGREVLDIVASHYTEFVGTLSEEQRAALAESPFDFADNLVFSARWEDLLGLSAGM